MNALKPFNFYFNTLPFVSNEIIYVLSVLVLLDMPDLAYVMVSVFPNSRLFLAKGKLD